MFDTNTVLLLAALAAPPNATTHAPTANDSVLASVVAPLVGPGVRVRVRTGFGFTEGEASAVDPLGLELRHEAVNIWNAPRVESIAWSQIERIDLRTRQPATGAKIGAVFGCLLGLATVLSAASYAESGSRSGGSGVLLAGAVGGIAGACVGGLLGGLADTALPAWKTIYERH